MKKTKTKDKFEIKLNLDEQQKKLVEDKNKFVKSRDTKIGQESQKQQFIPDDKKEIFKPFKSPDPEKINNYFPEQLIAIKEQLTQLNAITPKTFEKVQLVDSKDPKLDVFFKFIVNGKEITMHHYYYLSRHPEMEVLEEAINTDLAFKELFISFHPLSVRIGFTTQEPLLIIKAPYSKNKPISIPLLEVWNKKNINIKKIMSRVKQIQDISISKFETNLIGMQGAIWEPSLKVTLPVFKATPLLKLSKIINRIIGRSWRRNGPVALEELSFVRIAHRDFEGKIKAGELIVHKDVANDVIEIFKELFKNQFKIKQVKLIDCYFKPEERCQEGKDIEEQIDQRSMDDNNTSALFVRKVTKGDRWSHHSVGKAIDINPKQNPYVQYEDTTCTKPKVVLPTESKIFVNRKDYQEGMINQGVIDAFKKRGWFWGGDWKNSNTKDYQHFSKLDRYEIV